MKTTKEQRESCRRIIDYLTRAARGGGKVMRFPDTPREIGLDYLAKLDKDPPGTWLAQPKLDGRRRFAFLTDGKWSWHSKDGGEAYKMPEDLRAEFECLPWPDGIGLDIEWCGLRSKGDPHSLWVFDLLRRPLFDKGGLKDTFDMPFKDRALGLWALSPLPDWKDPRLTERISCVKTHANPGLVDLFQQQLTDPLSEGLVIRRADSKMIGSMNKCAVNPHWYKVKFQRKKGAE